ncbi:MAG: hypothetical protein Q7T20_10320, partial [Saprospiraceae bacterium]|nr:hypothetical protein [Saprospiraceae bacterium]
MIKYPIRITCSLLLFILVAFQGGLYAQKTAEQLVVSGIVLLQEKKAPDNKALLSALKSSWKLKADSVNIADKTVVFNTIGGATVMIAYLEYPAALDEVGAAARLSWLWK